MRIPGFRQVYFDPREPMTGHPAENSDPVTEPTEEPQPATNPEATATIELVDLDLGNGTTVKVPKESVAALTAFNAAQMAAITALRSAQKPEPETPPQPNEDEIDDNLIFSDPTRYRQLLEARIERRLMQKRREEEGMEAFFRKFYEDNPELKRETDHATVVMILNSRWNEFANMKAVDASRELGKAVRDYMSGLAKRFGGNGATGSSVELESGVQPAPRPTVPTATQPQLPGSLTEILRKRAAARAAARNKVRA